MQVNERIHLSDFKPGDQAALVEHLREKEIYDRTLRIPFPYSISDADWWIGESSRVTAAVGQAVHFAIRKEDGLLIGGCGFEGLADGPTHRSEIGYWLAKPFWGRGIMTDVVRALCRHGFEQLGLVKITAHVFVGNAASARVLHKCGFEQEGFLRKHYCKDGHYLDALAFGLLK